MNPPNLFIHAIDWARIVTIDFETYYDQDYTLSKMSTSEYVRDPRFKAQMMGIKVGNGKTRIVPARNITKELAKINWATHSLCCHNTAFDGFILHHHYGIHPLYYFDTLSMARGLHSNDIGAGLDEVSVFYGGVGKIEGALVQTKGVLDWDKALYDKTGVYCTNDVDETYRIFKLMVHKMPADELDLINLTCRMFCDPVLKVDIPRVEVELKRELDHREKLLTSIVNLDDYEIKDILKTKKERDLPPKERDELMVKKIIGSSERFADLIRDEGIEPPVKISPAWMKLDSDVRETPENIEKKYAYAFAKDDLAFTNLPEMVDEIGYNMDDPEQVKEMLAKQQRLQDLVDVRIAVKSTSNITRAERFLTAGANGMPLPIGYAYYAAHTGRFGGNNKMNFQNLKRGGELRLSILAPKGHKIAVADSGQIECRVNAWLWGQEDLLESFRKADEWDKKTMGVATGENRDAYCKFADIVYGREITTDDSMERFVGKVCIAEGELVLTDRGPIPIQDISLGDRLWDGVEWVSHDGVIDQGIKEVITYDGLTATPDHEVFTEDGRIIPLGQAASEMVGLQNTGIEGQTIRFCDYHVVADTPRKRLSVRQGPMFAERDNETDPTVKSGTRQDDIVLEEWSSPDNARQGIGEAVRRDRSEMQQPGEQSMGELWRARDQVSIQHPNGIYPMGDSEPASQGLYQGGDRQGRQRRELRAGESEVINALPTESEQAQYSDDPLARTASVDSRVPQPVEPDVHIQDVEGGDDRRTNPRKVRTYDIVNAGPRRRYTVSGKLCLNCVLGLGYMMGPAKLQMTFAKGALGGPPVYFELTKCREIVNAYRHKNNRIVAGWKKCEQIIADMARMGEGHHGPISWEPNTIWLPNGMALKYPGLSAKKEENGFLEWTYQSKDMRKKIYSGLLNENIVQALARIIVMWQMLQADKKYRVVMTTHDEFACIAKNAQANKCFEYITKCMKTPPDWCPDIPLNSEGKVDVRYSK